MSRSPKGIYWMKYWMNGPLSRLRVIWHASIYPDWPLSGQNMKRFPYQVFLASEGLGGKDDDVCMSHKLC